METPRAMENALAGFEEALRAMLPAESGMREMLEYALFPGGKRFRPALTLYLAECYSAREKAIETAVAIELFHNFTLVHDDIEDRDETRRKQPTLWKKYGLNHALNAGDALSIMAAEHAAKSPAAPVLYSAFAEVIEGQHLDFELAAGRGTIDTCRAMTEKKTGALVGAAAESAGIVSGQSDAECSRLRIFGRSLGTAFQLFDDYASIWMSADETGKDAGSDIRERKRTLPFFFAASSSSGARLIELYDLPRELASLEVSEARAIFDQSGAREKILAEILAEKLRAHSAIEKLEIVENARGILRQLVDTLVPQST